MQSKAIGSGARQWRTVRILPRTVEWCVLGLSNSYARFISCNRECWLNRRTVVSRRLFSAEFNCIDDGEEFRKGLAQYMPAKGAMAWMACILQ